MLDTLGSLERTHTCGELREANVGESVVLMGWVAKKRDFGVFTFIDLRDRDGVTQVVVGEEDAREAHAKAKNVRGEFVIAVMGEVVRRDRQAHKPKMLQRMANQHFALPDAPYRLWERRGADGEKEPS